MYVSKPDLGWGILTEFYFVGMDHLPKFDMVVEASVLLQLLYNDLNGDHIRTFNKYVGALTELINMVGWDELIEVLKYHWDNERMVFRFGTKEISPKIEEIWDDINTASTGLKTRPRK